MGFFDRFRKKNEKPVDVKEKELNKELNDGLAKTRKGFVEKVFGLFQGSKITDDFYDDLEEALIQGDVGVNTALDLVENLRQKEKKDYLFTTDQLKEAFSEQIVELLGEREPLNLEKGMLNIILVVGVNGVGKTTSIGKMANYLKENGFKVILGAGDTFRAAASEQLKIWGERVGCDVIAHQEGADPAAVVFDAIAAAKARECDVLIIDTAGRLHNKVNLMNELTKMKRIIDREAEGGLKEVLLVLDATTGQNALSQAKTFQESTNVTGAILTKLDGTAKGGVVLGINSEYNLPVKFIGVGEGIDHLQVFDPVDFAEVLFSGLVEETDQEEKDDVDDNGEVGTEDLLQED